MEMAKEEYLFKLALLEEEINRAEQQHQLIEQQILEMQSLQNSLKELEKTKEKQIWANLGKNIFIKTEIKDKNLLVDVGNRTFVNKSIGETLKIVEEQLDRLLEAKNKIIYKMQEIQKKAEEVIIEAQKGEG